MKRLWIAGAILAAVLTVCLLSSRHLSCETGILLDRLREVENAYDAGDIPRALDLAEQFREEYDRRTRLLPCFISHNELCSGRETAHILPAVLRQEDRSDFPVEAARCRTQLEHLQQLERPGLQNIL